MYYWSHRTSRSWQAISSPHCMIDFQDVNTYAIWKTHHTKNSFHLERFIFDGWNDYISVPLHKDDHHVTTFITSCVATDIDRTLCYVLSGDGYSGRFNEIVPDVADKTKDIDNSILNRWHDYSCYYEQRPNMEFSQWLYRKERHAKRFTLQVWS